MMGDTERFILEMNPEIEEENKLLSTIERFNDAFVFSKSSDYDVGRMWEVSKSIVAELGSYLNGKRDKINKGIIYKKEIAKNNNRERRRA
jgi:hypothetical protein